MNVLAERLEKDLEDVLRRLNLEPGERATSEAFLRDLASWSSIQSGVSYRPNAGMHPRMVFEHETVGILWKVHAGDRKDSPKLEFLPRDPDERRRTLFLSAASSMFPGLSVAGKRVMSVPLTPRLNAAHASAIKAGLTSVLESAR